jgi:hypothetical protein
MRFVLTGFTQEVGVRVFAFSGVATDAARTEFTVRADLALSRRYEIRMQELPLLCRGLLEQRPEGDETRDLTFTEEAMQVHAKDCAAARVAAAAKRRPPRRPSGENLGAAWRGLHQPPVGTPTTS